MKKLILLPIILISTCFACDSSPVTVVDDTVSLTYEYCDSRLSMAPPKFLKLELRHSGAVTVFLWTTLKPEWSVIKASTLSQERLKNIFMKVNNEAFATQLKTLDSDIIQDALTSGYHGEDFDAAMERLTVSFNGSITQFAKHNLAECASVYRNVASVNAVNDVVQDLAKLADELAPNALGKPLSSFRNNSVDPNSTPEAWIGEFDSREDQSPGIISLKLKAAGIRVSGASNLGVNWVLVYEKDAKAAMELLRDTEISKSGKLKIYKEPVLKKNSVEMNGK